MDPASITLSIIQTVRIGSQLLEAYQQGKLSDEEYAAAWADMRRDLRSANTRWEAAGDGR